MLAHGSYRLEWCGDILHSTPSGNFNEQGIQKYAQSLACHTANRTGWVLFLHLTDAPGLTPEALDELIHTYQNIAKLGCIAIAAEVPMALVGFIESNLFTHLDLPTLESADHQQLTDFINEQLSNSDDLVSDDIHHQ